MEGEGNFANYDVGNNSDGKEWLILTRMTTKTPMEKKPWTMATSFFDTSTNQWLDAFLAGNGEDFDNNDDGNNNHKDNNNNNVHTTPPTTTTTITYTTTSTITTA